MTTTAFDLAPVSPSQLAAREIRGELGRLGQTQGWLAKELHVTNTWVSRRIGARRSATDDVELTLEEIERFADVLKVPVYRLLRFWLDSDPSTLVRSYLTAVPALAEVVQLDAFRLERAS